MVEKAKKMAVLTVLEKRASFTLKEILLELGPGYTERTVRRWLGQMIEEGIVRKLGLKRGTHYQLNKETQPPSFFEGQVVKSIAYVRQPIFRRTPVIYNKKWLSDYQPNQTFYLSVKERNNLHQHGQRGVERNSAGTYARKIYNRLLIDLSYNSSRLEGNTYSLLDTEKLIFEGRSPEGKLDAEKVMILNHKEAIRHLVDTAPRIEINFNEICTLHFLLSDALVSPQYSGKIRDHGVRISGSTYVPLENKIEIEQQLEMICQKAKQIEDPFECSFFLLTHIAYLQAFIDVNKRTSRLSANIPLIIHNQVPLSFNDVEKEDYNSAIISIYELNDFEPLKSLYCFSYLRSCQQYDISAEAIGFDEIRVAHRQMRRDIIRYIVVHQLIGKSMEEYLHVQATAIPKDQRSRFINTVIEDLKEINLQRIAGLGITAQQLKDWLALKKG